MYVQILNIYFTCQLSPENRRLDGFHKFRHTLKHIWGPLRYKFRLLFFISHFLNFFFSKYHLTHYADYIVRKPLGKSRTDISVFLFLSSLYLDMKILAVSFVVLKISQFPLEQKLVITKRIIEQWDNARGEGEEDWTECVPKERLCLRTMWKKYITDNQPDRRNLDSDVSQYFCYSLISIVVHNLQEHRHYLLCSKNTWLT